MWLLEGGAVWQDRAGAARMSYQLRCNGEWQAQSAHLAGRVGDTIIDVMIARGHDGTWGVNGKALPASEDVAHIDLGFSPAAKTLVTRRMRHEGRDEAHQVSVFLGNDTWQLGLQNQTYRRHGDGRFSLDVQPGADPVDLQVDGDGFVTDYPGFWLRES